MILRVFACFCTITVAIFSQAAEPLTKAELKDALEQVLDEHETAKRTTVALKVVDLESGDMLFNRGGGKLLTPASNLKIYTSACALDVFGPDRRFETKITAAGPVKDGILDDNLVLIGGGD